MPQPLLTEPKITLKKLLEFGYEKEKNLFLSGPKKGKLTISNIVIFRINTTSMSTG